MQAPQQEDSDAAWSAVRDHASRDAKAVADEHASYNDLVGLNTMARVNHSKAYSSKGGTNTNFVESFFSRIQRAHVGIHHHFSTRYFDWYVADLAWREDMRRTSIRALTQVPAWAGALAADIAVPVRLLAGQQAAGSDLGRRSNDGSSLSRDLPKVLAAVNGARLTHAAAIHQRVQRCRHMHHEQRQGRVKVLERSHSTMHVICGSTAVSTSPTQ